MHLYSDRKNKHFDCRIESHSALGVAGDGSFVSGAQDTAVDLDRFPEATGRKRVYMYRDVRRWFFRIVVILAQ